MSFLASLFRKGSGKSVKDPVCGMSVDPTKAQSYSIHEGTTYYFCAARCKQAFDADPAGYIAR